MDWSFKLWSSVHLMIATKLRRTVWRDLLTRKANRKLPDSLSLKAECGYWTIKPQILLLRRASLSSALKLTYLLLFATQNRKFHSDQEYPLQQTMEDTFFFFMKIGNLIFFFKKKMNITCSIHRYWKKHKTISNTKIQS